MAQFLLGGGLMFTFVLKVPLGQMFVVFSPSGKLTWQWKIDLLKMYSLLKMGIFHCHFSLLEVFVLFLLVPVAIFFSKNQQPSRKKHMKTPMYSIPWENLKVQNRWVCQGWAGLLSEGSLRKPICWNYPPPSNSHHQDFSISSRESRTKPSFVTGSIPNRYVRTVPCTFQLSLNGSTFHSQSQGWMEMHQFSLEIHQLSSLCSWKTSCCYFPSVYS